MIRLPPFAGGESKARITIMCTDVAKVFAANWEQNGQIIIFFIKNSLNNLSVLKENHF